MNLLILLHADDVLLRFIVCPSYETKEIAIVGICGINVKDGHAAGTQDLEQKEC